MGALPIIGAGVSVISGIAGMNQKQKEADAQRQAISDEKYRAQAASWVQQQQLQSQAILQEQQYGLGVISDLNAYMQSEYALRNQSQNNEALAMQARYQIGRSEAEQALALLQQKQDIQRGIAQTETQARMQRGTSDIQARETYSQLQNVASQLATESDKALSGIEGGVSRSRNLTDSDWIERSRNLRNLITEQGTTVLGLDRAQLEAAMQNVSERDIINLAEQIGISDLNFSEQVRQQNEVLNTEQADFMKADTELSRKRTNAALQQANAQLLADYAVRSKSAATTDAELKRQNAIQQSVGMSTQQSVERSLDRQAGLVKGPGFLDWVNLGLSSYQALAPVISPTRSTQRPQYYGPGY